MADDLRAVGDLARASLVGEIPAPDIYYAALMAGPPFFADPRVLSVSRGFAPGTAPWMPAIDAETDLRTAVTLARGTSARPGRRRVGKECVRTGRSRGAPYH